MKLSKEEALGRIIETMDAVYVTDSKEGIYYALKTDDYFRGGLGEEGTYQDMMNFFMQFSIDKKVDSDSKYSAFSKYYVFFKDAGGFSGKFSRKVKLHFNNSEVTVQITNIPVDESLSILMAMYVAEEEYINEVRVSEKVNTIKSAYLFSMCCDLVNDTCSNMDMSEVDDNPVNSLIISYSQWRETIVNMIWPEDQKAFNDFTDPEYLKANLDYYHSKSIDCQMINLDGVFIWVKLIFSRIETGDDNDFRVVFVVEDIHESHDRLVSDLKKYEQMAMKDSLTGLLNHGHIETALAECLEKCREKNTPVSLIMLDIDHFKHVNDTFGHAAGDMVLKKFSSMAKKHLRTFGGELGRWGGEEFLGICTGITADELAEKAELLRKTIEVTEFDEVGHITSSFGVIEVNDEETPEAAFERIDGALYRAKEGGRNRVVRG